MAIGFVQPFWPHKSSQVIRSLPFFKSDNTIQMMVEHVFQKNLINHIIIEEQPSTIHIILDLLIVQMNFGTI